MNPGNTHCGDIDGVGASWFYNWSHSNSHNCKSEFIPMIWNGNDVYACKNLPAGSDWLLGFNEPNLSSQANMSPEYASSLWHHLEATGRKLVSPAMAMGNGIQWMDEFMEHCKGCRIDAIAIHTYEGTTGGVEYWVGKFTKYGKPVWVTEMAQPHAHDCGSYANSIAKSFESDSRVGRYAWFMNRGDGGSLSACSLFHNSGEISSVGTGYKNA